MITPKLKSQEISLNRDAVKKYLTECEKNELTAYETDIALAKCLKECDVSWYQKPMVIIPSTLALIISAYLAGQSSK